MDGWAIVDHLSESVNQQVNIFRSNRNESTILRAMPPIIKSRRKRIGKGTVEMRSTYDLFNNDDVEIINMESGSV